MNSFVYKLWLHWVTNLTCKVEKGESVVNCAVRELGEESGLRVRENMFGFINYVLGEPRKPKAIGLL